MFDKSSLERIKYDIENDEMLYDFSMDATQLKEFADENSIDVVDIIMYYMHKVDKLKNTSVCTEKLSEHQLSVKNGAKIAYKHEASASKVYELYIKGYSKEKIANTLGVSVKTITRRIKDIKNTEGDVNNVL